ncbi:MAG: hypothetical protein JNM86_00070 [Phycisphaerae bacterium]|nr:hypothetical protein [Phycisphaerae bacterium]
MTLHSDNFDRHLVVTGLSVAAQTLACDTPGTVASIRKALNRSHAAHRYELIRPLAKNFTAIAEVSPPLAVEIIHAAFSERFSRDDQQKPSSRLFSLTFNKHDLMDVARRDLADATVSLLDSRSAVSWHLALIFVQKAFRARQEHRYDSNDIGSFWLGSERFPLIRDHSAFSRTSSITEHDCWQPVLRKLRESLGTIAKESIDPTNKSPLSTDILLPILTKRAKLALVWSAFLEVAALHPVALGKHVWQVLLSPEVLAGKDIRDSAAALIPALWDHLSPEQRIAIERAILNLPQSAEPYLLELETEEANALLGRVPAGKAESTAAKERLAELSAAGGPPPYSPSPSVECHDVNYEEVLRHQGVQVNSPVNTRVKELTQKLKDLKPVAGEHLQPADVAALLPSLWELQAAPAARSQTGLHEHFARFGHEQIYRTLSRFAQVPNLASLDETFKTVRSLILEMSLAPDPAPPKDDEDQFLSSSWTAGQPRIEAASALMHLVYASSYIDTDIRAAISRLSHDPHPVVRHQVLVYANLLHSAAPDLMWELIDRCVKEESDPQLLKRVAATISSLVAIDADRVDELLRTLDRTDEARDQEDSIGQVRAQVLTTRIVREDHASSRKVVVDWVDDFVSHVGPLQLVVTHCRKLMVIDVPTMEQAQCERIRKWAIDTMATLSVRIVTQLSDLVAKRDTTNGDEWARENSRALNAMAHLANHIALEIFFASGADASDGESDEYDDSVNAGPTAPGRFFKEAPPLLDAIAAFPFVNAAYETLKIFEFLIPEDPSRAFELIHKCIMASRQDTLQGESEAADLVVEIVERYLADYRDLFPNNAKLRAQMMDVLDVFVQAGWTSALQLTFRLEEAFR